MGWAYLFLAIVTEVVGTVNMKLAKGFSKLLPSVLIFVFYGFSFALMALALKQLDVSIVYATWAGLGTALITVIGMMWFGEPLTALKLASISFIVIGVVGLSLCEQPH